MSKINSKTDVTDLGNAFNDEIEEVAINLNLMNVLCNLGVFLEDIYVNH